MIDYEKYLRVPYKIGGRTMDGCDCWGLICLIFEQELNLPLNTCMVKHKEQDISALVPNFVEEVGGGGESKVGLVYNESGLHAVFFLTDDLIIETGATGCHVSKQSKYNNQWIKFYEIHS